MNDWKNKYIEEKKYIGEDGDLREYFEKNFSIKFFYCPLNKILGLRDGKYEHQEVYAVDKKEYYENFPPVIVEPHGKDKFRFQDGFHRVNFCKKNLLPVPCVILTPKPRTHIHEIRYHWYYVSERTPDSECYKHVKRMLAKNTVEWVTCRKKKKTYKK